jgi:hypothetical protein
MTRSRTPQCRQTTSYLCFCPGLCLILSLWDGPSYAIPLAERVKNQLDTGRYSQFLEDAIEVVSDRMFLHFELLGDFAVP